MRDICKGTSGKCVAETFVNERVSRTYVILSKFISYRKKTHIATLQDNGSFHLQCGGEGWGEKGAKRDLIFEILTNIT